MNIRSITDAESASYDALAREHGSVFHSAEWTALSGDRLTRYGLFDKKDEIVGGFHLYRTRKFGLTILRNPPFTPHCGPFFRIDAKNPVAVLEAKRDILEAVAEALDNGSAIVSVSLDPAIQDALPFVWRKFKVIPGYTYIIDLSVSLDEVRSRMSPTRRNDISKAVRDGLIVRKNTDQAVVRDLVGATFSRQQISSGAEHLDDILFRFANQNNSYSFTTYRDDTAIACCFIIHDSKTAYYLLGGYRDDEKHHGAGALALLEAIKHAKELELAAFDFEGSMIPAIERYFRGFGGRLTQYFTVNKAWLPLEMALKFVKRTMF